MQFITNLLNLLNRSARRREQFDRLRELVNLNIQESFKKRIFSRYNNKRNFFNQTQITSYWDMEMGAFQGYFRTAQTNAELASRELQNYDHISNKKRHWNLTNYGKSLKKRKATFYQSTTKKIVKTTTTTTTTTNNENIKTTEKEITEIKSCCSSSCTSACINVLNNDIKDFKFTVSSYNILAPKLAQENSYLYTNVPYQYLDWNYRRSKIFNEIKYFDFDIYCFQEMQEDEYYNYFYPKLKSLGYYCLFKKRTGDKPDGCALIFKKRKFNLISYEYIEYFSPDVDTLNRENVAIMATLRPKYGATNEKICVVTTHLIFSPKRGDVKLAQLQKLFAYIDRNAFKRLKLVDNTFQLVYYPIILCGDMNLTLNSIIYQFLTESRLNNYQMLPRNNISGQLKHSSSYSVPLNCPLIPKHMEINDYSIFHTEISKRMENFKNTCSSENIEKIDDCFKNNYVFGMENLYHTFNFKSAYDLNPNQNSINEVTTCLPKNHEKVDYIFFHSNNNTKDENNNNNDDGDDEDIEEIDDEEFDSSLKLISILKLFNKNDVENIYLPNQHVPSDHFLLSAKFSLLYK